MTPDWPALFAPRPLASRAVELVPPGLAGPVWFACARAGDLVALPPEAFLTVAESTRASAFKFGQPRENFTLGRLAGKLALERGRLRPRERAAGVAVRAPNVGQPSGAWREVEIGNGERGEPIVSEGGVASALGVSLSHVNGLGVAVAFSAGERVGLDLELIDPKRAETVRKGVPLSAEEEAWLKVTSLPEGTALLLLWTARESLGKALGCGLACQWETLALQRIEVGSDGVCAGQFLHHPQFRCVSWVGPEAVMSLAFAAA